MKLYSEPITGVQKTYRKLVLPEGAELRGVRCEDSTLCDASGQCLGDTQEYVSTPCCPQVAVPRYLAFDVSAFRWTDRPSPPSPPIVDCFIENLDCLAGMNGRYLLDYDTPADGVTHNFGQPESRTFGFCATWGACNSQLPGLRIGVCPPPNSKCNCTEKTVTAITQIGQVPPASFGSTLAVLAVTRNAKLLGQAGRFTVAQLAIDTGLGPGTAVDDGHAYFSLALVRYQAVLDDGCIRFPLTLVRNNVGASPADAEPYANFETPYSITIREASAAEIRVGKLYESGVNVNPAGGVPAGVTGVRKRYRKVFVPLPDDAPDVAGVVECADAVRCESLCEASTPTVTVAASGVCPQAELPQYLKFSIDEAYGSAFLNSYNGTPFGYYNRDCLPTYRGTWVMEFDPRFVRGGANPSCFTWFAKSVSANIRAGTYEAGYVPDPFPVAFSVTGHPCNLSVQGGYPAIFGSKSARFFYSNFTRLFYLAIGDRVGDGFNTFAGIVYSSEEVPPAAGSLFPLPVPLPLTLTLRKGVTAIAPVKLPRTITVSPASGLGDGRTVPRVPPGGGLGGDPQSASAVNRYGATKFKQKLNLPSSVVVGEQRTCVVAAACEAAFCSEAEFVSPTCSGSPPLPRRWQFAMSGVGYAVPSQQEFPCPNYNRTWTLTYGSPGVWSPSDPEPPNRWFQTVPDPNAPGGHLLAMLIGYCIPGGLGLTLFLGASPGPQSRGAVWTANSDVVAWTGQTSLNFTISQINNSGPECDGFPNPVVLRVV